MERLTSHWANRIGNRLALSSEDQEIVAFALTYLLILVINLLLLSTLGLVFNVFWGTIYAAASAGLFRVFTGGAHFSSAWICAAMSSIFAVGCAVAAGALAKTSVLLVWPLLILSCASMAWAIIKYAPVEADGRPIQDWERIRFRKIALTLLPCWVIASILVSFLNVELALTGILAVNWQAFTLTGLGQRAYETIDKALRTIYIWEKKEEWQK